MGIMQKATNQANEAGGNSEQRGPFVPSSIQKIEDTGLSQLWLQDLALKILYFQGYMGGFKIAEAMALPFSGITDQILDALKREKFVEVRSSQMDWGKERTNMPSLEPV